MRLSAISEGVTVTDLDTDADWHDDVDEDVTCSKCTKIVHYSDAKFCDNCGGKYPPGFAGLYRRRLAAGLPLPLHICNNCTAEYEELNGELDWVSDGGDVAWFTDGCPRCSPDVRYQRR